MIDSITGATTPEEGDTGGNPKDWSNIYQSLLDGGLLMVLIKESITQNRKNKKIKILVVIKKNF